MDMEELQAMLAGAFSEKSTLRLSERNVVELVDKLKKLGLLEDGLMHTTTGREYVTRAQLRQEIKQQLRAAGGRVAIVDLPHLLGVDLVHCEQQTLAWLGEEGCDAQMVEGELLTPSYFDSVAMEVAEELAAAGSLSLPDLARRLALSSDLLFGALRSRQGSLWHGRLEGGLLYTDAYVVRLSSQIRGALRGTSTPCALSDLLEVAFADSAEAATASTVAASLVGELLEAGAASGTLRAGAGLWTPAVHVAQQRASISAFFQAKGMISHEMVRRMGVAQPRPWLAATHPEGIQLASAMLAPQLLQQIDLALEEAVAAAGWADAAAHTPPDLAAEDAAAVVALCPCSGRIMGEGGVLLAATCLMSAAFREAASVLVAQAAKEAATRERALTTAGKPAADSAAARTSKLAAAEDEDEWNTKGSGKKGSRAGDKKRKPAAKSGAPSVVAAEPSAGLTLPEIEALLLKAYPQLEEGAEGGLATQLAASLESTAAEAFEAARHAAFAEGADERKRQRDALVKQLECAWAQKRLLEVGAQQLFASDEGSLLLLEKHVLRTAGAETVDAALLLAAHDHLVAGAAQESLAAPLTDGARRALIKMLPPGSARDAAAAAVEALTGKGGSLGSAAVAVSALATESGTRLKALDKKAERPIMAAHQAGLVQQLTACDAPSEALLLAVPLLCAKACGVAVSLPGRLLGAAIAQLKSLPEAELRFLQDFHACVVDVLQRSGDQQSPAGSKDAVLQERLAKLKALCTTPAADSAPRSAEAELVVNTTVQ